MHFVIRAWRDVKRRLVVHLSRRRQDSGDGWRDVVEARLRQRGPVQRPGCTGVSDGAVRLRDNRQRWAVQTASSWSPTSSRWGSTPPGVR